MLVGRRWMPQVGQREQTGPSSVFFIVSPQRVEWCPPALVRTDLYLIYDLNANLFQKPPQQGVIAPSSSILSVTWESFSLVKLTHKIIHHKWHSTREANFCHLPWALPIWDDFLLNSWLDVSLTAKLVGVRVQNLNSHKRACWYL